MARDSCGYVTIISDLYFVCMTCIFLGVLVLLCFWGVVLLRCGMFVYFGKVPYFSDYVRHILVRKNLNYDDVRSWPRSTIIKISRRSDIRPLNTDN